MLALLPARMPAFSVLLDHLAAHPDTTARALGVSRRTVYRWIETDAPRAACLALWPLTRWGRSADITAAYNDADIARALARALERERATLQRRIAYLEGLRDDGAANGPLWASHAVRGIGLAAAAAAALAPTDQAPQRRG
jgi:hypothetical protein